METLPSDDRAPEPASRGRRLPRGAWFAIALAIVVLAIAAFQATGSSSSSDAKDGVAILDPNATEPPDSLNPLLPTAGALVGKPAPDLTLTRFDGSPVSLTDYAGTPTVVNFWAVNCTPCRTEMPALEQVHQAMGSQVAFVGVDSGDSIESGRPFAEQAGITYDLVSDPQLQLIAELRSTLLPTTVLIRADGTIARIHSGAVTADELQGWIQQDLLS
jgi:cytochrome c biogenesis protein CcmG, thiol:disulfide interchange protein DsbE